MFLIVRKLGKLLVDRVKNCKIYQKNGLEGDNLELVVHLFFNLSLLLVLLLFAQIKIERKNERVTKKRVMWYFLFATILCILFTERVGPYVEVDLREIPLILGGLYFGLAIPILFTIIIFSFITKMELIFSSTLFLYAVLAAVVYKIHPTFLKCSSNKRIMISTLIASVTPLITLLIYYFHGIETLMLNVWIAMICVPTLGTVLIVYAFESINKNLYIREQVSKTKKLEVVTHLGAAFSHEIRTPITTVKGFLQLIKEESSMQEKTGEYVNISIRELQKAENVISDYLTFAKPSFDQIVEIDVHLEMNHVLKELEPLTSLNNIEIDKIYGPIGIIQGDKARFHQCMTNIIKNSVESMPTGGTLTIKTTCSFENILIIIGDTGSGMGEKELSRLGEPFYSTTGGKGTGLGLMVSYSIIRAMEGTVQVLSEKGKGTSFEITFPQLLISTDSQREMAIPILNASFAKSD